MTKKILITFVFTALSCHAWAGNINGIISVGNGIACDVTTVQAGITAGNELTVHLTNTQIFRENLLIDGNSDQVIVGGFDSCEEAEKGTPGQNGYSVINGDVDNNGVGDDSVLKIEGAGLITLKNLQITKGLQQFNPFGHNGGGLSLSGFDGQLSLENMTIIDNEGNIGGGLSILNGLNTEVIINNNVFIRQNLALNGGGIWCSAAQIEFTESAVNAGVGLNLANNDGGGIHLSNGCTLTMQHGRFDSQGDLDFRGIVANSANKNGGGVYLSSGSKLILLGGEAGQTPVNFSSNTADMDDDGEGDGGAIYATDADTEVNGFNLFVEKNQANQGGAFYITEQAAMSLGRMPGSCWNEQHCNLIEKNQATTLGGVLAATNNALVFIEQAVIQDNRADSFTVAVITSSAGAWFNSNVITHNGNNGLVFDDAYILAVDDGSELLMVYNTIADNQATQAVFLDGGVQDSGLLIYGSIIEDPGTGDVINSVGADASVDCVNVHENASVIGTDVFTFTPGFKDAANRDYHLEGVSPLIDRCSGVVVGPDIDGEVRGWDDPTVDHGVDLLGDIGADENYDNDIIFKDGFESD